MPPGATTSAVRTPTVGRLHLITDARPGRDVLTVISAALAAGVDTVQVRVTDDTTDRAAYELATAVLARCRAAGVTCLINDRLDIALAVGADGGHVGADDLPVAAARRVLGPSALLGATAREPTTAVAAVRAGADYLGVGPVHATETKAGLPPPIGPAGLAAVASAVAVPVIAIGGISVGRVPATLAAGAHGVAVVGAVNAAVDPGAAATELLAALR